MNWLYYFRILRAKDCMYIQVQFNRRDPSCRARNMNYEIPLIRPESMKLFIIGFCGSGTHSHAIC